MIFVRDLRRFTTIISISNHLTCSLYIDKNSKQMHLYWRNALTQFAFPFFDIESLETLNSLLIEKVLNKKSEKKSSMWVKCC